MLGINVVHEDATDGRTTAVRAGDRPDEPSEPLENNTIENSDLRPLRGDMDDGSPPINGWTCKTARTQNQSLPLYPGSESDPRVRRSKTFCLQSLVQGCS